MICIDNKTGNYSLTCPTFLYDYLNKSLAPQLTRYLEKKSKEKLIEKADDKSNEQNE